MMMDLWQQYILSNVVLVRTDDAEHVPFPRYVAADSSHSCLPPMVALYPHDYLSRVLLFFRSSSRPHSNDQDCFHVAHDFLRVSIDVALLRVWELDNTDSECSLRLRLFLGNPLVTLMGWICLAVQGSPAGHLLLHFTTEEKCNWEVRHLLGS